MKILIKLNHRKTLFSIIQFGQIFVFSDLLFSQILWMVLKRMCLLQFALDKVTKFHEFKHNYHWNQ